MPVIGEVAALLRAGNEGPMNSAGDHLIFLNNDISGGKLLPKLVP